MVNSVTYDPCPPLSTFDLQQVQREPTNTEVNIRETEIKIRNIEEELYDLDPLMVIILFLIKI